MVAYPASVRAAVLELLEREHGIGPRRGHFPPWLDARLERELTGLAAARGCGAEGLAELLRRDRGALAVVADALRVGETGFFRDPAQFTALGAWIAAQDWGSRACRALSVGCSTGEEAYSLAALLEACRLAGQLSAWSVVGVDRSAEALATARRGEYTAEEAQRLPRELAACGLVTAGALVTVSDAVRRGTRFVERDATRGLPTGPHQIVLCKNLLIYFGDEGGERLVGCLRAALAPGGLLLVARSEVSRLRTSGMSAVDLGSGITGFLGG